MAFIVENGRSHDPERNLVIGYPRIEPAKGGVGTAVSFEFFVRRDSTLLTTIGFTGDIFRLPDRSYRWIFGLSESDIRSNLYVRSCIAPELADMPYLMYVATGLKSLFSADGVADEPMEGIVVTTGHALGTCGVTLDPEHLSPNGDYVLAHWFSGPRSRA